MCIIIDTNVLGRVFNRLNSDHHEFKPVFDWIVEGRGKVVYGGSKYFREIGRKYVGIFAQLRTAKKAVYIDNHKVDIEEGIVSQKIVDDDFDDQHLVALLKVSECKLICSADQRAHPFFKHSDFFSPAWRKPKIYSTFGNRDLLNDYNIADICKPCTPVTQVEKKIIDNINFNQ